MYTYRRESREGEREEEREQRVTLLWERILKILAIRLHIGIVISRCSWLSYLVSISSSVRFSYGEKR
jgi:hypothetical protein